jgi:hypothetical protein
MTDTAATNPTHPLPAMAFNVAQEQAEFEQHLGVLIAYDPASSSLHLERDDIGGYRHPLVQAQWHGWLSARRASAERAARTSTFAAWLASDIAPPASVTEYARVAYEAGRASAAVEGNPVAEKWAIFYDNLGEQPYTSRFVSDWTLYDTQAEANAWIARIGPDASSPAKHYSARPVRLFAADEALPARPPTLYLDEYDAASAGQAWLRPYLPQGVRLAYSDDVGSQAAPVKWAALFDGYDRLVAAYLLTRDAKNYTQLTVVQGRAFDCTVNPVSSRMCEHGTKSCTTNHAGAPGQESGFPAQGAGSTGGRRKILMQDGTMLDVTPPAAGGPA